MARKICCPTCKSKDLQYTTSTETSISSTGGGYSAGKGCLGYCLLGPLGLLCGACGSKMKINSSQEHKNFWVCKSCGTKFKDVNEINKEIISVREEKKKVKPSLILMPIIVLILSKLLLYLMPIDLIGIVGNSHSISDIYMMRSLVQLIFPIICALIAVAYGVSVCKNMDKKVEELIEEGKRLSRDAYIDE